MEKSKKRAILNVMLRKAIFAISLVIYTLLIFIIGASVYYFLEYVLFPAVALILAVALTVFIFLVTHPFLAFWIGFDTKSIIFNPMFFGKFFMRKDVDFSLFGGSREDREWVKEVREDMFFQAQDGIRVHAYKMFRPGCHKYVLIAHGYGCSASDSIILARRFYNRGYNVLALNGRGTGKTGGRIVGMGIPEGEYLAEIAWMISARDADAEILFYGQSMGGATVMYASGLSLPESVKVIVEDSGYASVYEQLEDNNKKITHLPQFFTMKIFKWLFGRGSEGYDIEAQTPISSVAKTKVPMLFLHGKPDFFVPSRFADECYAVCQSKKKKVLFENSQHVMACFDEEERYWETVFDFVSKYIPLQ